MEERSFFEYLGLADSERVHSQILAWIFSKDCKAIDSKSKEVLLHRIFNTDLPSTIRRVITESDKIDILITTDDDLLVIENKIKSSQHSDQLNRYVEHCKKCYPDSNPKFYYLTLINEDSKNEVWETVTYTTILSHLRNVQVQESNHAVIFVEYIIYLEKLIKVLSHFQKNTWKYDMVFVDGNKSKSQKLKSSDRTEYETFIAQNQLETILQKSFLVAVSRLIETESVIDETRGDALLDFNIDTNIQYEGRSYKSIIELQGNNIKFALIINGSNNYTHSDKAWVEKIIPIMENLSFNNAYDYTKCNKPKSKAYISISKKLVNPYWHMKPIELSEFLQKEIENGKAMNFVLIRSITNINSSQD